MVLRAELEQAQGEAKAVRAQMEELRTQLEKTRPLAQFDALKAQKRELHTELHKARAEAQEAADKLAALRMQTKPLLSMAETQQLQRALNDAVARVTEREAEVERLREAAAATRGTIKELKGQNDALAAQLGSMADPAAFSKAKAGERAAGQQLAEVRGELEREQKLLAQARATIKALKSESDGFRLQLRDRLPAAKVQAAVAEAKAAEKEAARLRQALENAEAGRARARQESSQTREELARVRATECPGKSSQRPRRQRGRRGSRLRSAGGIWRRRSSESQQRARRLRGWQLRAARQGWMRQAAPQRSRPRSRVPRWRQQKRRRRHGWPSRTKPSWRSCWRASRPTRAASRSVPLSPRAPRRISVRPSGGVERALALRCLA
jgi:chromosome segregation ATPase